MEPEPADEVDAMAILLRLRLPAVALRGVLRAGVASDAVERFNLSIIIPYQ